jgi:hypothetical protein
MRPVLQTKRGPMSPVVYPLSNARSLGQRGRRAAAGSTLSAATTRRWQYCRRCCSGSLPGGRINSDEYAVCYTCALAGSNPGFDNVSISKIAERWRQ